MSAQVEPSVDATLERARTLERELDEARELIDAIRCGDVDAVVVPKGDGANSVYTLRDADRPYRVLIEAMREGALTLSADGVVLFANHAIARMLGRDAGEVIGQRFARFAIDAEGAGLAALLDGGKGELCLRRADGSVLPVQLSVSALGGEHGDGEAVSCAVVTDLADEKRHSAELAAIHTRIEADAARRAGEGFARLIIDSATDYAIVTTDREGRITTWNSGARNIFNATSDDVVGRTLDFVWTAADLANGVPAAEFERAATTGRAEYERWHLRRDGSRFWASGLTMPLRDADARSPGFITILRDRSRSRATEAALEASEESLRFALSAGRLGAWELDLVSGALTASSMCRTNFGRAVDDPFTYEVLCDAVHPDDRARMRAAVEASIAAGADYDIEYRVVTPEGNVRWVQVRGRPVYAADGTPLKMVGVSLDTTARKDAEDALQRLNDTLEARVIDEVATRLLAEEALRQSQKMEAVGQLTGGVAHDFNNLLTIIKGSTDLLRRPNIPDDRKRRYIDAISETVDRAAKLTNQLLAFARRQSLKPEVFDVATRVHGVSDMLKTIVGARVRIAVRVAEDRPRFIEADASQFETALVNLAVNARDAMDGAGRLTIEVAAGGADDGETPSMARVAVRVTDTGCGIAADQIERIFEPFYTTKEVGKGTGLGLSQVYGFAKQSGGDVTVESALGAGTTITIYFPSVDGANLASTPAAASFVDAIDGGGRRVLVVEDNSAVGTFSTQILHDLGYRTTWAATAAEALAVLEQDGAFDIVFTDVVMPGMSGIELALELRVRHPRLPVVLTSGYSHVLAEEGLHGFELLKKPYSLEQLSRVLHGVLDEARAEPAST